MRGKEDTLERITQRLSLWESAFAVRKTSMRGARGAPPQGVLLGQQSSRQAFQSKVYNEERQSFAEQLRSASSAYIFQKLDENPDRRLESASICPVQPFV